MKVLGSSLSLRPDPTCTLKGKFTYWYTVIWFVTRHADWRIVSILYPAIYNAWLQVSGMETFQRFF